MSDSIGVSTGKTMLRIGLYILKYTVFLVVVLGKSIFRKIQERKRNRIA